MSISPAPASPACPTASEPRRRPPTASPAVRGQNTPSLPGAYSMCHFSAASPPGPKPRSSPQPPPSCSPSCRSLPKRHLTRPSLSPPSPRRGHPTSTKASRSHSPCFPHDSTPALVRPGAEAEGVWGGQAALPPPRGLPCLGDVLSRPPPTTSHVPSRPTPAPRADVLFSKGPSPRSWPRSPRSHPRSRSSLTVLVTVGSRHCFLSASAARLST